MVIRTVKEQDIHSVALIHRAALAGTPASRLGPDYVEALYRWFIRQPNHEGLVAVEDGQVAGVITLTYDLVRTQKLFTKALGVQTILGMARLFFTGRIRISDIVHRYVFEQSVHKISRPYVTIQTLAVAQSRRRQGVGKRLVSQMLRILQKHNTRTLFVDTRQTNIGAIRFYTSLGFRRVRRVADSLIFSKNLVSQRLRVDDRDTPAKFPGI